LWNSAIAAVAVVVVVIFHWKAYAKNINSLFFVDITMLTLFKSSEPSRLGKRLRSFLGL
jgi:hypothetical protein